MAAERGILMRSGESFQILKDITHVVLDKTGPITEGRPRLVAVETDGEHSREEGRRLAPSTEAASKSPLDRAFFYSADAHSLELPAPRVLTGPAEHGFMETSL